ncbi:hypothetical protein AAHE18_02G033100 [Arachis hypogaea]
MTLQLFPAFLCISNSSDSSSRGDGEIVYLDYERFLRIERLLAPSSVALLFAVRDALRFCLLEMLSCNHLKIMTQVGILAEFSGGGSCRTGSQPWKAFQNENPPLVRKTI